MTNELDALRGENARLRAAHGHLEQELRMRTGKGDGVIMSSNSQSAR